MNLTTGLAVWGALLSTILAVLEIIKLVRDRVRIKVTVRGGYYVYPENHPGNPYGKKSLISITTVNVGKRPVTLKQAGLLTPHGSQSKYMVSAESVKHIELTEGKSQDYQILEDKVKEMSINPDKYVAYALDATGRLFYSHNFVFRLWKLHRLR